MTSWSGGRHVNLEAVGRGRSGDVVAFWRMGPILFDRLPLPAKQAAFRDVSS
jgi:hypothetical protein